MRLLYLIFLLPLLMLFSSCKPEDSGKTRDTAPQSVVDSAIAHHGGKRFEQMHLSFHFRDKEFDVWHDGGKFKYVRTFQHKSGDSIKDILTNDGFTRLINGDTALLDEKSRNAAFSATNSVVYFALLPHGLNDAAVNKKYLEKTTIKAQPYHKIKVTFDEAGGGQDHQDIFIYWFAADDFQLDYLAYEFFTDGGGYRFREAYNRHRLGALLLNDYINYKPLADSIAIENIDSLYLNDQLEEVSRIDLENLELEQFH